MKISQIKISNILGIKELEFTPQGFNEFSGKNGEGKTSALEAIKAVVSGGHDATLLRKGEKQGEIVIVLDDQTEITKRVNQNTSPIKVVQDGVTVKKPTDILKSLTDMLSVNPVDFLRAKKQDRVKVLLETMPINVDCIVLEQISGLKVAGDSSDGLPLIDGVRKEVYDNRTGTNRAIKEKEATINQLRLAMPEAPAGVTGSEDELRAKLAAETETKDAELERVRLKLEGIKDANQKAIDGIREEVQKKIDELKAEAVSKVDAIQTKQTEVEGLAGAQRERTIEKFNAVIQPINTAIESIKANRDNAAKREQALVTIEQMVNDLKDLEADAKAQTESLDAIDAYKSELLESLPIQGLEVVDGEIFRDDVQFDRLNTAQQVDIAVDIAKLRAGDLGIVCVDGIELLDSGAFEEFKERALASGLQLFVSRVSDTDFAVNTSD